MTDELTPEQEEAVRHLLSEARHAEPVPAEVVARLDATLADLVADGVADEGVTAPAPVTDLSGVRRRRRNAGRLLLAAAAIVVGGVAIGQSLDGATMDSADSGADGGGAALQEQPRESAAEESAQDDAGGDSAEAPAASNVPPGPGDADLLADVEVPLLLSSDSFAEDVQRQLSRTSAERRRAAANDFNALTSYPDQAFLCADGDYGRGAKLPAYYDSEEAVLVLRRPRAGIQRVDLLACGTAVQLDSVDLPAP